MLTGRDIAFGVPRNQLSRTERRKCLQSLILRAGRITDTHHFRRRRIVKCREDADEYGENYTLDPQAFGKAAIASTASSADQTLSALATAVDRSHGEGSAQQSCLYRFSHHCGDDEVMSINRSEVNRGYAPQV